jgi:hypothetical protein
MIDGCRQQITAEDADRIADILCTSKADRAPLIDLLRTDPGIRDDILDDPKLIGAVMEIEDKSWLSPSLYFYIGIRHYLVRHDLKDRDLADYLGTMCVHFLFQTNWTSKAYMMHPETYIEQIIDSLSDETARENWDKVWCLHSHLGHYLLFFTGLLPRIVKSYEVNGGLPMSTYERIGKMHFGKAAGFEIRNADFYRSLHDHFTTIRECLNELTTGPFL